MSENNAPVETEIKSLLFAVKKELTITGGEHDIWLLDLLDRAGSRLNTTERVVGDSCTVEVTDNHFQLPKHAKTLYAFRGMGSCYSGIFIDTDFVSTCGCGVSGSIVGGIPTALNRRGRFYYFNYPVADTSEYEIAFSKVNRDCDGLMIVSEECDEARVSYVCWRFANAFRRTQQYTPDQVAAWYKDYNYQAARCRGNAAVRSKNQARSQINSRMNSIINLDTISWGSLGSMLPVFWYTNNVNP